MNQQPKERAMSENINDILKRYEDEAREKQKKAMSLRSKVMEALVAAGAKSVTVEFDGYGDSGEVGKPVVEPKKAKSVLDEPVPGTTHEASEWVGESGVGRVIRTTRDRTVSEAISEMCYALLENHGGWEINEGSFGEFTIDPAADEINLTFNQRVESCETSEETY
jgi:hypothetical protein